MLPAIRVAAALILPDTDQWRFRFNVYSETSNRVYTIAQNIKHKYWGCSCPGWKRHRKCKHLEKIGLPCHQVPHEIELIKT